MGSKRFALQGIEYAFLYLKFVYRRYEANPLRFLVWAFGALDLVAGLSLAQIHAHDRG
jgi:hypothetical protein